MSNEIISLREFARRIGVGEKTVRDGIKNSKIVDGVTFVNDKPKIIYEIAVNEVTESGLGTKVYSGLQAAIQGEKTKDDKPKKEDKKEIKVAVKLPGTPEKEVVIYDDTEILSLNIVKRITETFASKIKELEYKERQGKLIDKQEADSQYYECGQEIRKEFESLPGRIASKLIGITDVSKVTEILAIEVNTVLNKLFHDLSTKLK